MRKYGKIRYCRAVQATVDNMAHEHCVLGAESTNIHSVCSTVIPRHVWLHQRISVFHCTRIVCDVQLCAFHYVLRFDACDDEIAIVIAQEGQGLTPVI